ncbi:DsbA family protein [Actinoplanes sp. DH11]|uniref:DsbA family oxidoreductase n=1 Tax=Actinoplanes sp. DH11 TaxID=2857011 RepID=UPI001E3FFB51|nr:DsbA family oxidoreductase [Actinoplanes sp. DH11]
MNSPIKVDVWSDIACPFCYIGKRKFEAAAATSGVAVEVEYHSFELSPDTPEDFAGSHADYLGAKLGAGPAQVRGMEKQTTALAATVGLDFQYDKVRPTRTRKAHELLHYAKAYGRQAETKDRLLAAYFTDGVNVGRVDELADVAAELGFDRADVVRSLESGEYAAAVTADIATAREYGIQGVPFFIFENKYAVSGAQDPATFAQVLAKVSDERKPVA